jgi:SAM-dependent methyltransferase
LLKDLFDNTRDTSLANSFRRKRISLFLELAQKFQAPVKVLDAGGTENFWRQVGLLNDPRFELTIVNVEDIEISSGQRIKFIKADASDLGIFPDKSFDIVFSNSMIEHIADDSKRRTAANEIIRTGKSFFIQTPSYWIPIEPHFLFPAFQFLPRFLQLYLVRHFDIGWFKKCASHSEAAELIDSIHLLKKAELKSLFPNSVIKSERFLYLPKSYIAISQ